MNLFPQCSKTDRDTRVHTRTHIHREDALKMLREDVPNQTLCSFLVQMRLTSGLGTLNKHKNKTQQCACWAGWHRQWAHIGIVFHLLPWWPKQGGYWQKEKEIKLGRQWVLGERLSVWMRSQLWGWRSESPEKRDLIRLRSISITFSACVSRGLPRHSTPRTAQNSESTKKIVTRCGAIIVVGGRAKIKVIFMGHQEMKHWLANENSFVFDCTNNQVSGSIRESSPLLGATWWFPSIPSWHVRDKLSDPLSPPRTLLH